jgi:hypothetical protein
MSGFRVSDFSEGVYPGGDGMRDGLMEIPCGMAMKGVGCLSLSHFVTVHGFKGSGFRG